MPSGILCDGAARWLGRRRCEGVEVGERELEGGRRGLEVVGRVEMKEGCGEACEECEEVGEDGEPDGGFDGVLGVPEQAREVKLAREPAEEELDLPAPEVDLDDLGGGEVPA